MTGFGAAATEDQNVSVRAEVKSLNSKTLDLSVRLPRHMQDKEFEIRNMVSRVLDRGKVLLNVELEYLSKASSASQLNAELLHYHFSSVLEETRKFPVEIDHSHILQSVLRMPEVMSASNGRENREQEWQLVQKACEKAGNRHESQWNAAEADNQAHPDDAHQHAGHFFTRWTAAPEPLQQYCKQRHHRIQYGIDTGRQ